MDLQDLIVYDSTNDASSIFGTITSIHMASGKYAYVRISQPIDKNEVVEHRIAVSLYVAKKLKINQPVVLKMNLGESV